MEALLNPQPQLKPKPLTEHHSAVEPKLKEQKALLRKKGSPQLC